MVFTHNTLSENIRVQSGEWLNRHLAAAIDLHAQVRHAQLKHAHWNVRGPGFTAISRGIDRQVWLVESHIAPGH